MKYIITIAIFFLNLSSVTAQESFNYSELKKIIERNISVNGDQYSSNLSEYFLIDIKLNAAKDSIYNIDFFRKNTSTHYKQIESLLEVIKESWKPVKCKYNRLVIPVFLLFSSAENLSDVPIDFSTKLKLKPKKHKTDAYIFSEIIIQIHNGVK